MKRILPALVVIFLAGSTALSSAQMHAQGAAMMGGNCPMMQMMGGDMMSQGMSLGRHAHMSAMADGRLAYLKGELAITEKQAEAWSAYVNAVNTQITAMQKVRTEMMSAVERGTAVERMDARIKGMQAMVEAMSALKPATMKLYDVLTTEQRKIADDLIGVGCGGM